LKDKVYIIGRDSIPERIVLDGDEAFRGTFLVLPGASCDVNLEILLQGSGASVDIAGLWLCQGDEQVNFRTTLRHNAGGGTSSQIFKGIAGGKSKICFDGLVYVAPGADKTKAVQGCHTLLTSREATAEARPQLEIYADDVECSHGATSGYLNPDELFYMRSRGIPETQAKKLQIISFLSEITGRLDEQTAQLVYDSIS